jgi:hypothetical protein
MAKRLESNELLVLMAAYRIDEGRRLQKKPELEKHDVWQEKMEKTSGTIVCPADNAYR